jgi:predicted ATP-grasp superfamily ATP-dependent carboligase
MIKTDRIERASALAREVYVQEERMHKQIALVVELAERIKSTSFHAATVSGFTTSLIEESAKLRIAASALIAAEVKFDVEEGR